MEAFSLLFMKTSRCFVLEENLLQNELLILGVNILTKPWMFQYIDRGKYSHSFQMGILHKEVFIK